MTYVFTLFVKDVSHVTSLKIDSDIIMFDMIICKVKISAQRSLKRSWGWYSFPGMSPNLCNSTPNNRNYDD